MTSEIEIVEEGGGGEGDEIALRNDVYTAASYGDLEKLQILVESEGCSVSEPDNLGYYALQWAALNNRTAAVHHRGKFDLFIYFLVLLGSYFII